VSAPFDLVDLNDAAFDGRRRIASHAGLRRQQIPSHTTKAAPAFFLTHRHCRRQSLFTLFNGNINVTNLHGSCNKSWLLQKPDGVASSWR
jgi:hypothetical protein